MVIGDYVYDYRPVWARTYLLVLFKQATLSYKLSNFFGIGFPRSYSCELLPNQIKVYEKGREFM